MTPEVAEYLRALLLVGLNDRFDAYFDNALETEDPISDVILSLCSCNSNQKQVLSVLYEYTQTHPFDSHIVCNLVLEDILDRYHVGELTRRQTASLLYRIVVNLGHCLEEPWNSLTFPNYVLELCETDLICEEIFNQCFDAWISSGARLDPWELQRKHNNHKSKKGFLKLFKH